jgi:hypothetical protein
VQRFIRGTFLTAVVLACSLSAAGALAEGGPAISGAPTIAYGQPNFGNLTSVASDGKGCQREFWLLPVIAEDHMTLSWDAMSLGTSAVIYPVGTKDYSWLTAKVVAEASSNSSGAGQVSFAAPRTGDMVVMFVDQDSASAGCGNPGPYQFNASVVHKMIVSLRTVRKKTTLYYATFQITLYNPDGARIVPSGVTYNFSEHAQGYEPDEYATQNAPPFRFLWHWNYLKTDYRVTVRVFVSALGYRTAVSNSLTLLASSHCNCD